MAHWRDELNRISVEFWCGVGLLHELPTVADAANADLGEAHPDIWDFYTCTSEADATTLTLRVALELNRFVPASSEAIPYAQGALKRSLDNFLAKKVSVQILCRLVENLDMTFSVNLSRNSNLPAVAELDEWWMGNLWNSCDWCDESCNHENCSSLVQEAQRVSVVLRKLLSSRITE